MDAAIYTSLNLINQAFQQIEQHVQRLKDSRMIDEKTSNGWQIRAGELRAEINRTLTSTLRDAEEKEWAHFGKLRIEWEKTDTAPASK